MKKRITILILALSTTACNYSNSFNGSFNGNAALMNAYSKNINKYCVSLKITTESKVINSFINAQSVFDRNDLLKPTTFNTKGSPCGASLNEYLVGSRNINVLNISQVSEREQTKNNYCRFNTFNKYHFKESITFEMKSNTTDQTIGAFTGIGEDAEFVDYQHPVEYGEEYYCGRPGEN